MGEKRNTPPPYFTGHGSAGNPGQSPECGDLWDSTVGFTPQEIETAIAGSTQDDWSQPATHNKGAGKAQLSLMQTQPACVF